VRGDILRASAEYHLSDHPDVIYRSDALLLGIYRMLRSICLAQGVAAPDDIEDMDLSPIMDHVDLLHFDVQRQQREAKRRGKKR
jgi:hypothetical protein